MLFVLYSHDFISRYLLFRCEEQSGHVGKIPVGILVLIEFSEGKSFIEFEGTQVATDVFFYINSFNWFEWLSSLHIHIIVLYVEFGECFSSTLSTALCCSCYQPVGENLLFFFFFCFFLHAFGAWQVLILDATSWCCSRNDCVKTWCIFKSVV